MTRSQSGAGALLDQLADLDDAAEEAGRAPLHVTRPNSSLTHSLGFNEDSQSRCHKTPQIEVATP